MPKIASPRLSRLSSRFANLLFIWVIAAAALFGIGMFLHNAGTASAAPNDLSIEIVAGYNLVVDSNVLAPSTYAPSVATVSGRFCNTGDAPLTNVNGYIGDFSGNTPGIYPKRYVDDSFASQHPHLDQGDASEYYAFEHVGGQIGIKDASRYIGTLLPGECKNQYWHFTYPRRSNPDNSGPEPVWGVTNEVNDDLWLNFDIWGSANDGTAIITADQTWKMTMRNEISAMANKIKPNPDGQWFNTNTNEVSPGSVITSNGILYELGNIRQGFDNNNDLLPDYNAWLQPIGNPNYDPSCFRLIRTSGTLTVSRSSGKPDLIIPFRDQLYFTNLPDDNNGVVGEVFYTFLALDGPCNTSLSPYQEVASGYDNEKFNGDYGTGIPPVVSTAPEVVVDKTGNLTVTSGGTIEYVIDVANNSSDTDAGLPLYSMPVVMSDSVPAGTTFTDLSTPENTFVLYSDDYGATYTTTNLGAAVTTVQWWLTETLAAGASAQVTMSVDVPVTTTAAFIENCADASFGSAAPFAESCATTLIQGNNSIGDEVWRDENSNGAYDSSEDGIPGVVVSLYYDQNSSGTIDAEDIFVLTATTSVTGYYRFDDLPDGDFVVVVSIDDPNVPFGYGNTTPLSHAVSNLGLLADEAYTSADFGFGPVLLLEKNLISGAPAYEGQNVIYTIDLINTRPGDGTGQATSCQYTVWAGAEDLPRSGTGNKVWSNKAFAFGDGPDGLYADSDIPPDTLIAGKNMYSADLGGEITAVEAVFQMYFSVPASNDEMLVELYHPLTATNALTDTIFAATALNGYTGAGNAGLLVWDVSSERSWQWSDFSSAVDMSLAVTLHKTKGSDALVAYMDAFGFRITTDQACGGSESTLDPVPLTDLYDADKLEFVSAMPAQTSVSTGNTGTYANTGAIDWANLGPLYAGQTKSVTVTFKAKEPAGNAATTITNTAIVTDAKYLSGRPVHEASDDAINSLLPTASIGDLIWSDTNGDGVVDDGEQGIPSVGITLTADITVTYEGITYPPGVPVYAFTDVNGNYLFDGLLDGSYTVVVDRSTIPGTAITQTYGYPGTTLGSDTASVVISSAEVTEIGGTPCNDCELDVDFGYTIPSTVFGTVWEDVDGDGIQETGENGIGNVEVTLYDGICTVGLDCNTTLTDADGGYIFTDLPATGTYSVIVGTGTLPAGGSWSQTDDPDDASAPCADCDNQTDSIVVSTENGNLYGSYDFGYTQSGSSEIGDTVYADWDGDGIQDVGEAGIDGVTLTLYKDIDGDGQLDLAVDAMVSSTVTSNGGDYLFSSLPAGSYFVVVDGTTLPAGFNNQSQDPDEAGTCSVCDGTGLASVDGTEATNDYEIDFGYKPVGTASIGDLVWLDADADGLSGSLATLEPGESGLVSVTVTLWHDVNASGSYVPVVSTSTDLNGTYLFENLPPGSYQVTVDVADTDLPTDALGNLYVPSTPATVAYTLATGEQYLDADFGFSAPSMIGDTIFWDANRSGGEDWDESGISGVVVTLTNVSSAVVGGISYAPGAYVVTRTTDINGNYLFGGLSPATYAVSVDTSGIAGDLLSDPDADGVVCTDSTVTAVCDSQTVVSISSLGQIFLGADFGYLPAGVIGDRVWRDVDVDGIQDAGEPGIAGVVVTITNGIDTFTTTTDFDGLYSFSGLGDDTWTVTFEQPANMAPTGTIVDVAGLESGAGSVGISTDVVIIGGSVASVGGISCTTDCDLNIDSGFVMDGSYNLGGTVFYDAGNNGGLYGGSPDLPLAGITLYLWDSQGRQIGSTTTDADGNYAFGNLITDTYTVTLNVNSPELSGYNLTTPAPGSPSSLLTAELNEDNPSETDLDFGFYSNTQLDFGDLPSEYSATELADEGARHEIDSLMLGATVTAEGNGQESAFATGDNDDPGISTSGTTWTDGSETLSISIAGGDGCLVGWIDWNGDGDFADSEIGGVSELVVNTAVNSLSSSVAIDTPLGTDYALGYPVDLFARFRLFPLNDPLFAAAGLTLTDGCPTGESASEMLMLVRGAASGGEVEDYMWSDTTGPTSISLQRLDGSSSMLSVTLLTAIASLMMITMMFIWRANKQLRRAVN